MTSSMEIEEGLDILGCETLVLGNMDPERECQECGETDILDSTLNICFECWCLLDLKEHETQQKNAATEEE